MEYACKGKNTNQLGHWVSCRIQGDNDKEMRRGLTPELETARDNATGECSNNKNGMAMNDRHEFARLSDNK